MASPRSGFSTRTAYFRRRSPGTQLPGKTNPQEIRRCKNPSNSLRLYVAAGFVKIHLDAPLCPAPTDPTPLDPMVVAANVRRPVLLPCAAETTATDEQKRHLTYVIGTEVPVPGAGKPAPLTPHVPPPRTGCGPHAAKRIRLLFAPRG